MLGVVRGGVISGTKPYVPTVRDATEMLKEVYRRPDFHLACFRIPLLPAARDYSYVPGAARRYSPPGHPTLADLASAGVLYHERTETPSNDSSGAIAVSERYSVLPEYAKDYIEFSQVPGYPMGKLCFARATLMDTVSVEYSGPHAGSYLVTHRVKLEPSEWVSRLDADTMGRIGKFLAPEGFTITAPFCAETKRLSFGTLCKGTATNHPSFQLFHTHTEGDKYDGYGEFTLSR
ncbi:MAG: hypothetical protein A2040_09165 [Rhodocyclales bacterium GWA2_65_19]|nr:MAG: hypothetical protein A2040_09165 [Rhodocyclales bacterium GWA2_65_19]